MSTTILPSFGLLRDVALRVPIGNALGEELSTFASRQHPPQSECQPYLRDALTLVQKAMAALDVCLGALTEQRFAAGDAMTLRQRLVGDPKRSVDNALSMLKQKLSGERQEWSRRLSKQCLDVLDALPKELQSLATTLSQRGGSMEVTLEARWAVSFSSWLDEVFGSWARHLAVLLPAKTEALVAPELATINEILGTSVSVAMPRPVPPQQTGDAMDLDNLSERLEVPRAAEVFVAQLKSSLQSVAMLAGLIVIPVVTSLMGTSSPQIRALVMACAVAPVAALAVLQTRKHRHVLLEGNLEKARDKIRKTLDASFRSKLERFKPEAERASQTYLSQVQQALLGVLEPAIVAALEQRERSVASQLAGAQMEADRLADQINSTKQLKGGLGQLALELRKRLSDLGTLPD